MAGCVFGYFADCTVVIVSLNCYTAFVPKCWRRNAEVQYCGDEHTSGFVSRLVVQMWPWPKSPHFVFSGYQLTEVCQK